MGWCVIHYSYLMVIVYTSIQIKFIYLHNRKYGGVGVKKMCLNLGLKVHLRLVLIFLFLFYNTCFTSKLNSVKTIHKNTSRKFKQECGSTNDLLPKNHINLSYILSMKNTTNCH